MSPIDPQILLSWNKACSRAAKARGLGFELLSRSLPGSLIDGVFSILCPEPALLGVEPARLAALSFLRAELNEPSLELKLLAPDGTEDWGLSFRSQAAHAAELSRLSALDAFGAEELTLQASNLGARIASETFRSWP